MFEGLKHLISLDRPPMEVLRDVFDILIVSFIVYRALLVLRGTPAMKAGAGFVVFGLLYLLAKYAELVTLMSVLSWLASSAILIVVVVFQNDIKRALERVGSRPWLSTGVSAQERVVDEVVESARELARHRIGALICIERDANVLEFVQDNGINLDAEVTSELLVSLFIPEALNKTHDGAVLIRNLKIARAGVFFPLPKHTHVDDANLGSRHRAAIGITEETDAVVVVVSEERGSISLAFPNGMAQNVDGDSLKKALLGLVGGLPPEKTPFLARLRSGLTRAAERSASEAASSGGAKSEKPASSSTGKTTGKTSVKASSSKIASPKQTTKSSAASGRHKPLKKDTRTSRSGRFGAVTDEEEAKSSSPPRVSMPMPSTKDRKEQDEKKKVEEEQTSDGASDKDETQPTRTSVSKPMAPTELPSSLTKGDS